MQNTQQSLINQFASVVLSDLKLNHKTSIWCDNYF